MDKTDIGINIDPKIKSENDFERMLSEEIKESKKVKEVKDNKKTKCKDTECNEIKYKEYNPFNPNGDEGSLHNGHRMRLKDKLNKLGFDALPPHEQLEIILFSVIPRGDTNIIAHRLLNEFGSLYIISHTDVESLCSIEGVGVRTAEFLRLLPDLAGAFCRSEMENKKGTALKNERDAIKYVKSFFMGKNVEYFYMFSLNQNRRIISVRRLSKGSKNSVDTSIKNIISAAIEDGANEVILAHNHPGGSSAPSQADLETTYRIENLLHSMGIKLWLHLIIADNDCRSINFFNGDIYK